MKTLTLPIEFYSDEHDPDIPECVTMKLPEKAQKQLLNAAEVCRKNKLNFAAVTPNCSFLFFNDESETVNWPHPSMGPGDFYFICYPAGGIVARFYSPNGQYIETESFSL